MTLKLAKQPSDHRWVSRKVTPDDADCLGMLMLESFKESSEYEGYKNLRRAMSRMMQTLLGKYGKLLQRCSYVIMDGPCAVCASLVTWSAEFDCPRLSFSMTHPEYMNKGMGQFLLRRSINALLKSGYEELVLEVADTNERARHVYEKMGFEYVD